jgi:osmotically-inducible protein OsmY
MTRDEEFMRVATFVSVLVLAGLSVARLSVAQQGQVSTQSTGGRSSSVFPSAVVQNEGDVTQFSQTSEGLTSPEVERLMYDSIHSESGLAETAVVVETNDKSIRLSGTVARESQRGLVEQIARSYAGTREIVNQIKIK